MTNKEDKKALILVKKLELLTNSKIVFGDNKDIPDTIPSCFGEYDSFYVSYCHICRVKLVCARTQIRDD